MDFFGGGTGAGILFLGRIQATLANAGAAGDGRRIGFLRASELAALPAGRASWAGSEFPCGAEVHGGRDGSGDLLRRRTTDEKRIGKYQFACRNGGSAGGTGEERAADHRGTTARRLQGARDLPFRLLDSGRRVFAQWSAAWRECRLPD